MKKFCLRGHRRTAKNLTTTRNCKTCQRSPERREYQRDWEIQKNFGISFELVEAAASYLRKHAL